MSDIDLGQWKNTIEWSDKILNQQATNQLSHFCDLLEENTLQTITHNQPIWPTMAEKLEVSEKEDFDKKITILKKLWVASWYDHLKKEHINTLPLDLFEKALDWQERLTTIWCAVSSVYDIYEMSVFWEKVYEQYMKNRNRLKDANKIFTVFC